MSRKFPKQGWIVLGLLLCLALVIFPACGETLPSEYIGSGKLDGKGIPVDFFSDINVRKGFCYAFDYDTYIEDALSGQGLQMGSPVVEGLYGYNPDASKYSYNLTLAKYYLEHSGWGNLSDIGFKFTLLYNAGNLPRKTACEILAENLAKINPKFQVSIQPLAWPTILGKIFGTRDMPMFQIGWQADFPHADNFIEPFMSSTGTFSEWQGYGSAALDAQIQAALQDTNPTTQLEKYYALQQRYYDDAPGIMLAQQTVNRYFSPYISGYYWNPMENSYPGRLYDMAKANNVTPPAGSPSYKNDGIFVMEDIGDVDSFDPAWAYDTASGTQIGRIYETLLYYHRDESAVFDPVLATNWTWSDNDTTVTFHIRSGVKFQNGDDLTAEDVKYSLERALVQDRPGGPLWLLYGPLLGVSGLDDLGTDAEALAAIDSAIEIVDGDNVAFHLVGAYWKLPFLQILCGSWGSIVDKSWCIAQGDWDGTAADIARVKHPQTNGDTALFDKANGTGPWELASSSDWDHGVSITLTKNPDYWQGNVPFDTVITKIVEEWTTRKLDFQNGNADMVYVPMTNYPEMSSIPGIKVYSNLPTLTVDAMFFNMIIGGPSS
jgi:ABC-type transport system substrate-binding protein